jgi:hypothetical protein
MGFIFLLTCRSERQVAIFIQELVSMVHAARWSILVLELIIGLIPLPGLFNLTLSPDHSEGQDSGSGLRWPHRPFGATTADRPRS